MLSRHVVGLLIRESNQRFTDTIAADVHACVRFRRGLMWACQTRADIVTPEQLKLMALCGCVYVYYGLESGSDRVLNAIAKPLRIDPVKKAITATREYGMNAVASFLFGVPLGAEAHDTAADWMASVELIRAAQPTAVVPSIFAYYPGSPAWLTLPKREMGGYVTGVNRDAEIWKWFDDGFGSIHAASAQVAEDIRGLLDREIPEFLAAH